MIIENTQIQSGHVLKSINGKMLSNLQELRLELLSMSGMTGDIFFEFENENGQSYSQSIFVKDFLSSEESQLVPENAFGFNIELSLIPYVGQILENSNAFNSELKLNDLIVKANSVKIKSFEQLKEIVNLSDNEELNTSIETLEKTVQRLLNERESLGAVNLRAEEEMNEMRQKIELMSKERVDLELAIEKLKSGIFELNKEGRQRLKDSFELVNQNFKNLFKKLFGGGDAELKLVGDEDPLKAGLEILASPPGKKLQLLSLLSGGEQALTAISLIFSVFLCNPAPICILDEVDAALDDSNVSRFCNLLDKIVDETETYFLVVTHHRLTMAKMNRLFGVTMEQKGISRLVSVDLEQANKIKDIA